MPRSLKTAWTAEEIEKLKYFAAIGASPTRYCPVPFFPPPRSDAFSRLGHRMPLQSRTILGSGNCRAHPRPFNSGKS